MKTNEGVKESQVIYVVSISRPIVKGLISFHTNSLKESLGKSRRCITIMIPSPQRGSLAWYLEVQILHSNHKNKHPWHTHLICGLGHGQILLICSVYYCYLGWRCGFACNSGSLDTFTSLRRSCEFACPIDAMTRFSNLRRSCGFYCFIFN